MTVARPSCLHWPSAWPSKSSSLRLPIASDAASHVVIDNGGERLVQFMSQGRRHLAHGHESRVSKSFSCCWRLILRELAVGDIAHGLHPHHARIHPAQSAGAHHIPVAVISVLQFVLGHSRRFAMLIEQKCFGKCSFGRDQTLLEFFHPHPDVLIGKLLWKCSLAKSSSPVSNPRRRSTHRARPAP